VTAGPRFSILMPTRNRAGLLRLALRSALELRGDDYEVVVSDNCSSDETRDVVEGLGDRRVRYVRTPRPLPVSANMEFVLDSARGEHVTFLNDDDALLAGTLDHVRVILDSAHAELIVWPYCHYFYPDWHQAFLRNTLVAAPFSGRYQEVRAADTLTTVYGTLTHWRLPTVANAVCHTALIQRARRHASHLFPTISGDIFSGILFLVESVTYCWADIPLSILGRWPASLGSSNFTGRGRAGFQYSQEFPDDATPRSVPLRARTPTNLLADALLRAKTASRPALDGIEVDWQRYFVRHYLDLTYQYLQGSDISQNLSEFWAVLATQPALVRDAIVSALKASNGGLVQAWQRRARHLVNRVPALGWLEAALRRPITASEGGVALRGADAGFGDILECARIWDRELVTRRPAKSVPAASQNHRLV
jgi:hypothetical protein